MSGKSYPTRKTKSPLFDSTSSDLFDDLLGKLDKSGHQDSTSNQIAGSVLYNPVKDTKRDTLLLKSKPSTTVKKQTSKVSKERSPFVPKESSPPVVVGSTVEARKRENETSRSVSRYNYSYSPR